jgi:hypothetical protein
VVVGSGEYSVRLSVGGEHSHHSKKGTVSIYLQLTVPFIWSQQMKLIEQIANGVTDRGGLLMQQQIRRIWKLTAAHAKK